MMTIKTDNYLVVESGSIVLHGNDYVEFEIKGLRFRFTFTDDEIGDNKGKTRITGALNQDAESQFMDINVVNYNALFTTPNQMLNMGKLEGKDLYIIFSVVALNGNDGGRARVFHYTWYKSR